MLTGDTVQSSLVIVCIHTQKMMMNKRIWNIFSHMKSAQFNPIFFTCFFFFMGLIVNFTCLLARCLRTLLQRLLEGKLSCKENCPTPCRFDYDHQQSIDLSYIKINKKFRTYFAADLYICRCSNVWQIVSHVLKTLHICGIKKVCNEINRISSYFGSVWLILYLTWFFSFRF